MSLGLYNDVLVTADTSRTEVLTSGETDPSVPTDSTNYIARGAETVFRLAGRKPMPLRFEVEQRVPVSRGLGSSANALVAGAVAADALLGSDLDPYEMVFALVDVEGHAEQLAACLFGGLVAVAPPDPSAPAGAPGSKVPAAFTMTVASDLCIALAIPDLRLETRRARDVLPRDVPFGDAVFNVAATAALCQGLAEGDRFLVRLGMRDSLHQDARAELNPASHDVMAAARDSGAWGSCWSGAGPTILAVSDESVAEEVSQAMVSAFESNNVDARGLVCGIDFDGCLPIEIDGDAVSVETDEDDSV